MDIPNVKFNISANGLGLATADIQKIPGMVLTGVTVTGASNVTTGKSYQIFSKDEAKAMGITPAGANVFAYKHISDFYDQAGKGAELWFMIVPNVVSMKDMADVDMNYAKKLLADAKGAIRVIGFVKQSGTNETITNGLDADVDLALIKAQALCEDFSDRYKYVRAIVSGNKFNGTVADLKDYSTTQLNKVAVLLTNNDGAGDASIGMLLGRLASIPVQRKISRVKDGAVEPLKALFTGGQTVESLENAWNAIHTKNYIFLRSFPNRSGYFFTSDKTCTMANDDFNSLARGLVMDKVCLLSYAVLTEELSDEIPVTPAGTIHPAIIKSWQNAVEKDIKANMTDKGELSGFTAFIDENQSVLTTNNVDIALKPVPVGYSDSITANIGFATKLE